ncbi:MAG: hypothetical protein ACR2KV_16270 [Solirubrobacteraceae bacterium]
MAHKPIRPLGAVVRGAIAGTAGTLAMDLVMWQRYRQGGGEEGFPAWGSSAGLESYDDAPAPAQVGRRIVEGYLQRELPASSARLMNNVMHLLTGTQWGVVHGILAVSSGRSGPVAGVRTGMTAWLASYALLAPAGLYEPIWAYPLGVLADDASAHVVYGLGTAVTFRVLAAGRL